MTNEVSVAGVELLVAGLDDAITFFSDVLGMPVVHRGPAGHAPGEVAVIDGGGIAITLFEPAASGDGVLADRTPRFSQLVLGGPPEACDRANAAIVQAGVPLHRADEAGVFVPPEAALGILGFNAAIAVRSIADDA